MKKVILSIGILGGLILGGLLTAHAAGTVCLTFNGCTGTSTPSGIMYGDNGATNHLNTVTVGTGLTFSGGTLSTSLSGASVISYTAATGVITTQPGNFAGSGTYNFPNNLGVGSSTPWATLSVNPVAGGASNEFAVGSSTATAFLITNNGNTGVGTTSPGTLFSIGNTGGINLNPLGTSTWSASTQGLNITNGCYAFGGVCLTAGSIGGGSTSAVNYASTSTLPSNTYSNGVNGVGATITEVGLGALYVDGNNPSVGQRILVKNEGTAANNGIYIVTVAGSGIAAFVLTRDVNYDTPTEITPGINTYVISGTANSDTTWAVTYTPPLSVGVTSLSYVETANGNITLPISIANGGTNATSFTTSGNSVYYNGSALVTALSTLKVTTPFASSTAFTAASELNAPNSGTIPTLYAGDLYVNTGSGTGGTASTSVLTSDGSITYNNFSVHSVSSTVASSTLVYQGAFGAAGTTTIAVSNPIHSSTVISLFCKTDVGTAVIGIGTGSATSTGKCSIAGTNTTISANNTFNGRQTIYEEWGTTSGSPNNITTTVDLYDRN